MADIVNENMERMVPELEDLMEKGLFSEKEVQSIVKRRRHFEYRMQNRAVDKRDVLQYITYEFNLELLRRKRKDRMGLHKKSSSDYAGIRRIHSLFTKALKKFKDDIRLWLQYADFCTRTGSVRTLGRLFPKAIQLHPRNVGLWIHSASFEISCNKNYDAARKLLQRGLRVNKKSERLWLEYFRMELLFLQRLALRREALGIDEDAVAEATSNDAMKIMLDGAIPKTVFQEAVAEIRTFEFATKFVELSDDLPVAASESIGAAIESHIVDMFGDSNEEVWNFLALRTFRKTGEYSEAVKRFEDALKRVHTTKMYELYVRFLAKIGTSRSLRDINVVSCRSSSKGIVLSPTLFDTWCGALMRVGQLDSLQRVLKASTEATPKRVEAWTLRIDVASRLAASKDEAEEDNSVLAQFEEAFAQVDPSDSLPLHLRLIDRSIASNTKNRASVEEMFRRALRDVRGDPTLCMQYVTWASTAGSRSDKASSSFLERAIDVVLRLPFGRPDDGELFATCIGLLSFAGANSEHIRSVFELAILSLKIKGSARVWIDYITFLRRIGSTRDSTQAQWRASKALGERERERLMSALD